MIEYLAGIFDAEGYVRIRKTSQLSSTTISYTPEVSIYMCNKNIIHEFSKLYGVPIKMDIRGNNRQIAYYVSLGVKQLRNTTFIADFLPFLNEKRLQLTEVDNLLKGIKNKEDCYNDYMRYKKYFDHPVNGELSYEYIAGIIDGDGWLSMFNSSKGPSSSVINNWRIGLEQRYRPMVEYISKFDTGNCVSKRLVRDSVNHIQTYSWQSSTDIILPLLKEIYPFLIEKQYKCELLIDYITQYQILKNASLYAIQEWRK